MRSKTSIIIYTNVTKKQQIHLTAAIKYSITIQTDLRRKGKKKKRITAFIHQRQLLKAAHKLTVFHFKLKVLFPFFFQRIFCVLFIKVLLLCTGKENTREHDFSSCCWRGPCNPRLIIFATR